MGGVCAGTSQFKHPSGDLTFYCLNSELKQRVKSGPESLFLRFISGFSGQIDAKAKINQTFTFLPGSV